MVLCASIRTMARLYSKMCTPAFIRGCLGSVAATAKAFPRAASQHGSVAARLCYTVKMDGRPSPDEVVAQKV
jgi:hypothetical protein